MIIFFRYFSIYSMEEIIIFSIKIIFINDLCSKPNFYNKWSSSLSIGENLALAEIVEWWRRGREESNK